MLRRKQRKMKDEKEEKSIWMSIKGKKVEAAKELYNLGGRTFMVLNLAPIGCYPSFLVGLPHNSSDLDRFGCMVSYNNAIVNYNNMLKESLKQTRENLSNVSVIYVDTYTVLLENFHFPAFFFSWIIF
ncbi:hypothetical protein RYX36_026149 [Vicia faba]